MAIRNAPPGRGRTHRWLLHRVVAPAVPIPLPVVAARHHEFLLRDSTLRRMLPPVPRHRQTKDLRYER